jgi:hypothetical protein
MNGGIGQYGRVLASMTPAPAPMPLERQAELVIQSLMRDLLVVDHIVFADGKRITARAVRDQLRERQAGGE